MLIRYYYLIIINSFYERVGLIGVCDKYKLFIYFNLFCMYDNVCLFFFVLG